MRVTCNKCGRGYDDAEQWTICPHSPLGMPIDDLCPKCDTLRSVHGPCTHQVEAIVEENKKLKAVIDQHNLCYDLHGKVGVNEFAQGCINEMIKVYGHCPLIWPSTETKPTPT